MKPLIFIILSFLSITAHAELKTSADYVGRSSAVQKSGSTMTGDLTVANTIKITHGTSLGPYNLFLGGGLRNAGTTGFKNTCGGDFACDSFDVGADTSAWGYGAFQFAKGDGNTGVGKEVGRSQIEGSNNEYFGAGAGYSNRFGSHNLGIGGGSLYNNLTDFNTGIGYQSLVQTTIGTRNLGLGLYAGYSNITLSDALWIANAQTGLGSNLITGKFDQGKVGINIDPGLIDNSAALQIVSTTKGLLPPVMTATQMDAIPSPAEGLTIHDSTSHMRKSYNGSSWKSTSVQVQGAGVTPVCATNDKGALALTSTYILCVCNGSSWVQPSIGLTACTF